jgi:hypothetical protein
MMFSSVWRDQSTRQRLNSNKALKPQGTRDRSTWTHGLAKLTVVSAPLAQAPNSVFAQRHTLGKAAQKEYVERTSKPA